MGAVPSDLELLQIETETIWGTDQRGRINGPELVITTASVGSGAAIGARVPDAAAALLKDRVTAMRPSADPSEPPAVLEACRRLLEDALLGPVRVTPGSGPSYLIEASVTFASSVPLVRSDGPEVAALAGANPGNWEADEWQQLLDGDLGAWVMAIGSGAVISICHTPAIGDRGAEAGVWTRPQFRGRGLAATVTAAWAALMRPGGRYLFYSTSRTNRSSQRVAARLGLRPIGWLWQLAASGQETPRLA